jgi:hypothetical protein
MLSIDPNLTPDQIEEILSSTAVDYGAGGYDTTFGHGFINARSALEAIDTGETCAGDVDGDGMVGVSDILLVVDGWGPCDGCDADIDGDGTVGVSDILAVVDAWGVCI